MSSLRYSHIENVAWHNSLPSKHVSATIICWNSAGQILFVLPDFDDYWLLPGGVVEANESPLKAAIREAKEETGLEFHPKRLHFIGVNYAESYKEWDDFVHIYFSAGVLDSKEIAHLGKKSEKLHGMKFLSESELGAHVPPHRLLVYKKLFAEGARQGLFIESRIDKTSEVELL